jgi:hypothetical protein
MRLAKQAGAKNNTFKLDEPQIRVRTDMTKDKSKESWKQRHPKFFDIAYKVIIYAVIGLGAWVISSNYYNFYVFLSEQKHLF